MNRNSPFPPHSTPSATENINLNADADADFGNEGTVLQQKKTKCSARWRWSCKENEHLARCWVSINKDSVIRNDKKLDQMWIRIAREYNKNRPANTRERHWEAMKTHFYTLQRSLIAFNADYIAVKEACESSRNDVDILMETLKRWVEKHGNQTFKLLGMWQILSECPKWANQDREHCCKKKVRTSTPEVSISSSNNENDVEDRTHPIDQKAAKRKAKAKVGVYEEFIETLDKNMAEYRAIPMQKLKEIRYRNKKREYDILMRDTSGMTQEQLRIHQLFCDEIKKKWGI